MILIRKKQCVALLNLLIIIVVLTINFTVFLYYLKQSLRIKVVIITIKNH